MRYFGPALVLPLSESGIKISLESSDLVDAELVWNNSDFLDNKFVVFLDSRGDLINRCSSGLFIGGHFLTGDERDLLFAKNIQLFSLRSVYEDVFSVCDSVMELARVFPDFILCINSRIVDDVGGLSVRDVLYFVQRLRILKNYSGALVIGDESFASKLLAESSKPHNH